MLFAPAKDELQPKSFAFTPENEAKIKQILAKYPAGREQSAVMPMLDLAQRQSGGWLPRAAIEVVADRLTMPFMKVYEVATFYTMYNLAPVGKHLVQVCRTTPCWLRGSDAITDTVKEKAGIGIGETSADGQFTLVEVECLGCCSNAPMVQINDDYYEDLTPESMAKLMDDLKAGKAVPGSQAGRVASAPAYLQPGSQVQAPEPAKSAAGKNAAHVSGKTSTSSVKPIKSKEKVATKPAAVKSQSEVVESQEASAKKVSKSGAKGNAAKQPTVVRKPSTTKKKES